MRTLRWDMQITCMVLSEEGLQESFYKYWGAGRRPHLTPRDESRFLCGLFLFLNILNMGRLRGPKVSSLHFHLYFRSNVMMVKVPLGIILFRSSC